MNTTLPARLKHLFLAAGLVAVCLSAAPAKAAGDKPETFASPESAVGALIAASRDNDTAEMLKIFGPAGRDLISSGDTIEDRRARARFVAHYAEGSKILRDSTDKATLIVGTEQWPFPIPIVREAGVWHFDTQAGAQEILNRRIGRNELNAMEVCRHYVLAQRDYAADMQADKKPLEYAQKFVSSPGMHDGLYWPVSAGEKQSPIGPQMAHARAEGYGQPANGEHAPYYGYFYKILTRQGAAAPGGARDYVVGGRMTGGFALIAFPAKYGDSGVMTFVINQEGIVFEKNLGPDTTKIAAAMTEFNPDLSWKTR
ncbi:MAG TPA: DUF2950 domain-containing protein [Rhizomicrobium sp.]|nr:DUF2950 domain-containing protein [Rhizomicrobium sp.]